MSSMREALELLRERGLRVTPQRRAILQAFRGTAEEHLSAEEVLSRASSAVPEIGRGTVYASLAELTELGLLGSVGHTEPIRYETNAAPHDHFYCRVCLRMFDVELGGSELLGHAPEGHRVEQVFVRAEGVCRGCRDYHRGLRDGAGSVTQRAALDADALGGLACAVAPSPVGELGFAASEQGITRVAFADHADFQAVTARAARRGKRAALAHVRRFAEAIDGYLAGSPAPLMHDIDWNLMAAPTAGVLRGVLDIPYGESRSYEDVSSSSPYECGWAMGSNPIPLLIPCHRVRCGPHRPETYVGGPEVLRFLHRLEAGSVA